MLGVGFANTAGASRGRSHLSRVLQMMSFYQRFALKPYATDGLLMPILVTPRPQIFMGGGSYLPRHFW